MSTSIYDFPPVERKYVAVRRFRKVQGEKVFKDLLEHLDLTYKEFVLTYGDQLAGNPTCLNDVIVKMVTEQIREGRRKLRGEIV